MIPSTIGFLNREFEIEEQPNLTYKMDLTGDSTKGFTDGLDAVRQAIFKILNTERYQYIMYSWNYGIETSDLYGEPVTYVCPELERRITEALLADTRINSITDFKHDIGTKGVIHTSFTVHTVYGDMEMGKEVPV